jgi:hypothetical protein
MCGAVMPGPPVGSRPNRFWPGPVRTGIALGAKGALLALGLALNGCGATAPCPTPTAEIDRSRDEAERLERQISREAARQRQLKEQRAEAASQVAATQAAAAIAGEPGVRHAIKLLEDEIDRDMALLGINALAEMRRELLMSARGSEFLGK